MSDPAASTSDLQLSRAPSSSSTGSAEFPACLSEDAARVCSYCTNVNLLREILPPKRCDYCREWKCQFCTLKFPLIKIKKLLPKAMKGNSRICVQCFSEHWQQNGATTLTKTTKQEMRSPEKLRDSRSSSRRSSMFADSRRRGNNESFDEAVLPTFTEGSSSDEQEEARVSRNEVPRIVRAHATTPGSGGLSYRVASFLGLSADSQSNAVSVVDLWISLFSASILLLIAITEGLTLQQRVCYCIATYGLFLTVHPWIHHVNQHAVHAVRESQSITTPAEASSVKFEEKNELRRESSPREMPHAYITHMKHMDIVIESYLREDAPWMFIRNTSSGGIVSELSDNDSPFPIFKIEEFITGISISKFLSFIDSKDIKDRSVWDTNVAHFRTIEAYGDNITVCQNTQKSFLGGLIAPRDFCIMYVTKPNSIMFSSVEHENAQVKPGAIRGNIRLSCFHCEEAVGPKGEDGFMFTYISQLDVGGSLPTKLLYNGTIDTMEKMVKTFKTAKKVFYK